MKLNRFLLRKNHLPPGTPIYTGSHIIAKASIELIKYNLKTYEKISIKNIKELSGKIDSDNVIWIEVKGAIKEEFIKDFGEIFKLHNLVLEDVLNVSENPKAEDYNDYFYLLMKNIAFNEDEAKLYSEQISLILKDNIVISFQESEEDLFSSIKSRIINNIGKVRSMKSNYLVFCILDLLVDNYLTNLSSISEKFESLELKIIENFDEKLLSEIYYLKKDISNLKKNFWYINNMFLNINKYNNYNFTDEIEAYFRDLSDNSSRILDNIDNLREFSSSLIELNNSLVGNKLNQIMKTLTMISTIFIPLSFLVGFYGMNFKFMPELSFKYAYPILISFMVFLSVFMVIFFKKRKWF